jgi:hypothetical protein
MWLLSIVHSSNTAMLFDDRVRLHKAALLNALLKWSLAYSQRRAHRQSNQDTHRAPQHVMRPMLLCDGVKRSLALLHLSICGRSTCNRPSNTC